MSWQLVSQLHGLGRDPRLHGNGFVQLYLNQNERLHVWCPDLPPIPDHNATIHDHTWLLKSTVLLGAIEHITYDMRLALHKSHEETVAPYNVFHLEGGMSGKSKPKTRGQACYIEESGRYMMWEGSKYSFERNHFHETKTVTDWSATLITKLARPSDAPYPRVIAPRGERPVDAFSDHQTHSLEDLWDAIGKAVLMIPDHRIPTISSKIQ